MSPVPRKAALAIHLTVSVGWIGGVIAYLVLGLWAVTTTDDTAIRAAWAAMDTVGWYAIVPLAAAAWVTGVVMALGTHWGLFRHYWVVISFALTTIAVAVLVLHMPDVSATAAFAATASTDQLATLGGDLAHRDRARAAAGRADPQPLQAQGSHPLRATSSTPVTAISLSCADRFPFGHLTGAWITPTLGMLDVNELGDRRERRQVHARAVPLLSD